MIIVLDLVFFIEFSRMLDGIVTKNRAFRKINKMKKAYIQIVILMATS